MTPLLDFSNSVTPSVLEKGLDYSVNNRKFSIRIVVYHQRTGEVYVCGRLCLSVIYDKLLEALTYMFILFFRYIFRGSIQVKFVY